MNMRECKNLKPGATVREAYPAGIHGDDTVQPIGLVLHKEYVEEQHSARTLGGTKKNRYDLWVYWIDDPPYYLKHKPNPVKLQCWEVMMVKNAK